MHPIINVAVALSYFFLSIQSEYDDDDDDDVQMKLLISHIYQVANDDNKTQKCIHDKK